MAKQNVVVSDLSGETGAETVKLSLGGESYWIDLTPAEVDGLRADLAPYLNKARKGRARQDLGAVREWARKQGYQVGERGRIDKAILDAYNAAH